MKRLAVLVALAALLLLAQPASAAIPIDRSTDAQWAQTLAAAGQWSNLQVALQVMFAESGGNPTARNPSGARGAWQFMPNTLADDNCAYDPVCSTAAAFRTSSGGANWSKWEAYTTGAYTTKAAQAAAAIQAAGLSAPGQPQPPALPALPGPRDATLPGSGAGMGIDGLIHPPPIQHGNQPFIFEHYTAGVYMPLHQDPLALAQSALGALLGFDNPQQVALNFSMNQAAEFLIDFLLLIGMAATRLLAWSLRVDLLPGADGPLNGVVTAFAEGLYEPLIPLLLTLFLGWLIWTWLLRRRAVRGFVGIGWLFLAMTVAAIYFANPTGVLDQASAFTAGISKTILGAVGGADTQMHRGDPTVAQGPSDDAELRLFGDRFWTTFVYQPWTTTQFGKIDPKAASGAQLGVELLDKRSGRPNHFDDDLKQQPQEVRDWYDGANGPGRLLIALVAVLVAAAAGLIFLAAALVRLASMAVFLAALMTLPVILLLALHPTIGRKLLMRWLELAVGALWRTVIYSIFLAVMLVLVGVAAGAAAIGGWGLGALVQLASMAGILVFRKPLLALFGQLGGHHAKVEHVGASRTAQTVHQRLEARRQQRHPIPAFARRQGAASTGQATARASGSTGTAARTAASGANAGRAATAGASAAAGGGWVTLAAAAAIKGGQVAIRTGERAKRELQGSVTPFLLNGRASSPPPRRMPEKPLGADRSALWTHVRRQSRRRTAPVQPPPQPAALAEPESRPKSEPRSPNLGGSRTADASASRRRAKWTREAGGAYVLTRKP